MPSDSFATSTTLKNTQTDTNSVNNKPVSIDTTHFIIMAGQGANGLNLNMTVQRAIDKYGKQSDFNQGIACGDITYHTNRFYFTNSNTVILSSTIEGSEMDRDLTKSEIDEIGILYPANATTDKGIILKTDSLNKIIKTYGNPEKYKESKDNLYLHYYSQGISFDCDIHNHTIERIAIYKKGKQPDFYYWRK
jgi:hypothetical protein